MMDRRVEKITKVEHPLSRDPLCKMNARYLNKVVINRLVTADPMLFKNPSITGSHDPLSL
jgi:hypothetical protein